jgi:hypothetical protein
VHELLVEHVAEHLALDQHAAAVEAEGIGHSGHERIGERERRDLAVHDLERVRAGRRESHPEIEEPEGLILRLLRPDACGIDRVQRAVDFPGRHAQVLEQTRGLDGVERPSLRQQAAVPLAGPDHPLAEILVTRVLKRAEVFEADCLVTMQVDEPVGVRRQIDGQELNRVRQLPAVRPQLVAVAVV